ncbi:MAG: HNH endonuclease [Nitrospirota bacterium]
MELPTIPEEIDHSHERLIEGAATTIAINAYERNPKVRKLCVENHGAICAVCKFTFKSKYGSIGQGYIHVHHLTPMSEIKEDYTVDPIRDLRPICPNCHAMIHSRKPPYTIEELREIIKKSS